MLRRKELEQRKFREDINREVENKRKKKEKERNKKKN